jgi:hypothetical protein
MVLKEHTKFLSWARKLPVKSCLKKQFFGRGGLGMEVTLPWATMEVNHLGFIACLQPEVPYGGSRKLKDSSLTGC